MGFRIYIDESGTHGEEWLIIGVLFVPDHGTLHAALCQVKERHAYFNRSPKRSARYKETHLSHFASRLDVRVGEEWVNEFIRSSCYYRSIVIDWSIWKSKYFGNAFEAEALKRRRAYKKWAEMLLQPELKASVTGQPIYHARLYLDKLRIMYGYDVIPHLRDRFTQNYRGESPHIEEFQHTDSWRDANQCLQLCDLLTGGLYQALSPSQSREKLEMRDYLENALKPLGVQRLGAGFWRQYAKKTLTKHFPKFSAWFWRPED